MYEIYVYARGFELIINQSINLHNWTQKYCTVQKTGQIEIQTTSHLFSCIAGMWCTIKLTNLIWNIVILSLQVFSVMDFNLTHHVYDRIHLTVPKHLKIGKLIQKKVMGRQVFNFYYLQNHLICLNYSVWIDYRGV